MMTKNTKGDWTIPNVDRFYDEIIWSNPVDYYDSIMDLIKNELYRYNIRLIFDDGGQIYGVNGHLIILVNGLNTWLNYVMCFGEQ